MSYRRLVRILNLGDDRHASATRPIRRRRNPLALESLEDRCLLSGSPGSVTGSGSTLSGQDSFSANIAAALVGSIANYTGTMSFSDSKAGDTFVATSINSVLITESPTFAGSTTIDSGFTISGYATLNGKGSYAFTASGSLPFPSNTGSTGGIGFTASGTNFNYSTPWSPWTANNKIAVAIATPTTVATRLSLNSSANPSVYGQPVTFSATISPGIGYVGFSVDGGTSYSEPIVNGVATYTTTGFSVGTHSIVATYAGNVTYGYSSSKATLSQVTNQAGTTTTLSPYTNYGVGQPMNLTATVAPVAPGAGKPTGTVTFYDGTTVLGTGTLSSSTSTASTGSTASLYLSSGLSLGAHSITAVYSGNGDYKTSTSAPLNKSWGLLGTSTTLSATPNPVSAGTSVTLMATVKTTATGDPMPATLPAGTVSFYDNGTLIGSPVKITSAGVATLTTGFGIAGSQSLTAVYSGSSLYTGSTSTSLAETVNKSTAPYTPKIYSLSPPANPAVTGQPITLTVYVSPNGNSESALSGTVTLTDNGKLVGTVTLTNAEAVFNIASITAGTHNYVATYSGNAAFTTATGSLTETANTPVLGTVVGSGTTTNKQDSFSVNVLSQLLNYVPTYSGTLTFSDSKAGDTFVATSITSIQISEATPVSGPSGINGGFTITGTATLNGSGKSSIGLGLYTFTASGSLPFPANTGSTGGIGFTVTGPNGFSYSTPWAPWDKGSDTILITETS